MVDADLTELIDDDSGVFERRLLQQVVEQRSFTAAQEARDDRDGNLRHEIRAQAAFACFSSSAE
jgi:hypothetical protein